MNIVIATPCYNGSIDITYARGLVGVIGSGLAQNWITLSTESLIPRGRNMLAHRFLEMGGDVLFFVDADIGFTAQDFHKILSRDLDICAGVYPKKTDGANAGPVYNGGEGAGMVPGGEPEVIEVEEVGTGFMAIKRKVFEDLIDIYGKGDGNRRQFVLTTDTGQTYYDFFPVGAFYPDTRYLSEDYGFCYLARSEGFKIHVDQTVRLTHAGRKVWG